MIRHLDNNSNVKHSAALTRSNFNGYE